MTQRIEKSARAIQVDQEKTLNKEVDSSYEYYSHPVVSKTIAKFCGADKLKSSFDLTNTNNNLNDWLCEYLTIANIDIATEKQGRSPAKSIKPSLLAGFLNWQPTSEIFMSLWQKETLNKKEQLLPSRSIFIIDVEYFNKKHPERFLLDQTGVFDLVEPAYQIITDKLRQYGFNYTTVMTGKGYHFIAELSNNSPVMEKLIAIAHKIDPALRALQENIPANSKRDRPVPLATQQAHLGMGRLVQYFVSQVINEIRADTKIAVEISDINTEGLAIDLTPNLVRAIDTGCIGVPGSIYLKHQVRADIYNQNGISDPSQILTRIFRETHGEKIADLQELIISRQNLTLAIDNLTRAKASIPESTEGIGQLLQEYENSDLYKFHQALDETPGDHWTEWPHTYRNYDGIAGDNKRLREILAPGSHALLEPGNLNYTLHHLFEKWGGNENINVAGHIRTFLRSVYEDPRFNWRSRFTRHYSAAQHAEGWATIILGQRFDKK
jgi:hypothetical protein